MIRTIGVVILVVCMIGLAPGCGRSGDPAAVSGDPATKPGEPKAASAEVADAQEKQKSLQGEIVFKGGKKEPFKILTGVRHVYGHGENPGLGGFELFMPQAVPGELVFGPGGVEGPAEIRYAIEKVATVKFAEREEKGRGFEMKVTISLTDGTENEILVNAGIGAHAIDILRPDGAATYRYNMHMLAGAKISFSR